MRSPLRMRCGYDLCHAAHCGDFARLSSLVQQGLDINESDYDKRTALHLAASEGKLDVVKFLKEKLLAHINAKDRWGGTALDDAIREGHISVKDYLNLHGAERGNKFMVRVDAATMLCHAASNGDMNILRDTVKDYEGTRPRRRRKPRKSDPPNAEERIIDTGDYDDRTALHLAACGGDLSVVRCLVDELGANVNVSDRWGNSPLDDAYRYCHEDVITFFECKGAVSRLNGARNLPNLKVAQNLLSKSPSSGMLTGVGPMRGLSPISDLPPLSERPKSQPLPDIYEDLEVGEECQTISSLCLTQSTRFRPRVHIELRSTGSQTVDTQALPPRLANSPIFPAKEAKRAARAMEAAESIPRAPVRLKTRKVVMPEFKETPAVTMVWLIKETLLRFNPRGKGCCEWHVCLKSLLHHAAEMANFECDRKMRKLSTWQCNQCLALNEEDAEGEAQECLLCWSSREAVVLLDSSESACNGDEESLKGRGLAGDESPMTVDSARGYPIATNSLN